MQNAIVTGANGFIGRWLIHELTNKGIKVVAVVKDNNEDVDDIKLHDNVEIVYCDLSHLCELADITNVKGDTFFHLAWAGSTGDARADYELQLENAKYTVDAVEAAALLGCKRFVGAGTLAEFDCGTYIPQDGSTPNAVTCYGTAKIAAHYMSKAVANNIGIEHVWAYLSNTYGIGNRTQNFVNFASKTMITGQPANFTVAEQYYDFVYVSDIAQALYLMGEKGTANSAYYIGSTQILQLKEYIKKIRDAIDPLITINFGAIPFNGVILPKTVFNCDKLVEDTGYCPRISFDDGIKITVAWLKQEIEGHRL